MKIGALIPARLQSERLPRKALLEICGRPMIYHLLDRVVACSYISTPKDVVVCTTKAAEDTPLVEAVTRYGASVFRGDSEDIIRRFADAIEAFGFDAVVQADGDDPLSATEYMDLTTQTILTDKELDIVTVSGLPLGIATKCFTVAAMKKVVGAYQTKQNDTGFIYFFTRSGICKHRDLKIDKDEHKHDQARLTLDYEVDLELFRSIFEALYKENEIFDLATVVSFLNAHPDLVELNRHVDEEYWQRTRDKAQLTFRASDGSLKDI